jgi:MurNAc alpha-1-phosphate uridylyltransferase
VQCVILAGGLGRRMHALTGELPKALVPVCGRPFVDHQLTWLRDQGVRDVVFCIGHRGRQIRDFVGDGGPWDLLAAYVDEGDNLRGTAGALRLAVDEGALAEEFVVLYGDSYLQVELKPIWEEFRRSSAPALMVVLKNDNRWDASNVHYEDGMVVDYDKLNAGRRPELAWIDYGLTVLARDLVAGRIQPGAASDLADLYRELSLEGTLAGFEVDRRFYEVGSPEGLRELEQRLASAHGRS